MATIISSKTSGVGGLSVTGDASGILQLASADGTTALTINASQNVGIGTSSPVRKLHVASVSAGGGVSVSGTAPNISITNADTEPNTNTMASIFALATAAGNYGLNAGEAAWLGLGASRGNFVINPNYSGAGTKDIILQPSSGNVGIGTTAPANKLHVSGSKATNSDGVSIGQIFVSDTSIYSASPTAGIQFGLKYNAAGDLSRGCSIQGTKENATDGNFAQALLFTTQPNSGSPAERMRIDSSGNVGIGTSNPAAKLQVYGNNGSFGISAFFGLGAGYSGVAFGHNATIGFLQGVTTPTSGVVSDIAINPNGGNVGIGTSSPDANYKLEVVQSANIKYAARFRINDSHTAAGYNYGVMLQNNDATVNNYTALSNMDSTGTGNAWIEFTNVAHSAVTPQGAIGFNTRNGGNYARKMTIDKDGNVGIGTSSPACKLNVYSSTAQNDAIGFVQIENPTAASGVNASYTAKNYSGTSQFMQWENHGLRIGSRIITNGGLGKVVFTTGNDVERMTIDSAGTLVLNQGQIKFPSTQVASSDVNTLDDYEEGTWTPNINGASVGSFSQKTGYYVKIGRQVTCWFRCDSGNTGAGGATQYVTGLPFNITTAINNSIMGQIGTNGPATRTLDLMALNANFAVAYVYTGGSQEQTAISFAAGCFTYGID